MSTNTLVETPPLSCDQVLRIARTDAEKAYQREYELDAINERTDELNRRVIALLAGVERLNWRRALVVAVGLSAGTWLMFAIFLGVPFPKGPLGI